MAYVCMYVCMYVYMYVCMYVVLLVCLFCWLVGQTPLCRTDEKRIQENQIARPRARPSQRDLRSSLWHLVSGVDSSSTFCPGGQRHTVTEVGSTPQRMCVDWRQVRTRRSGSCWCWRRWRRSGRPLWTQCDVGDRHLWAWGRGEVPDRQW